MTHDPREALEPCPFCGARPFIGEGGEPEHATIACNNDACIVDTCCVSSTKDEAVKRWNTRALTASPGEQKPPPAAGWDIESVADAIDLARYQPPSNPSRTRPRPFSEADRSDREYATRLAKAALKALRREAPAPEGVVECPACRNWMVERVCEYCGGSGEVTEDRARDFGDEP